MGVVRHPPARQLLARRAGCSPNTCTCTSCSTCMQHPAMTFVSRMRPHSISLQLSQPAGSQASLFTSLSHPEQSQALH